MDFESETTGSKNMPNIYLVAFYVSYDSVH